jgi:methionyl-tRNA synthetase
MNTDKRQGSRRKVLITAGLPYSNGRLHVGHLAGCYIPADIYARYLRLTAADVRFVCGSDDHGVAIMLSAEKEGKTPAEIANFYREKQSEDFKALGINFDIYSGTSVNPYHAKASQDFFRTLYDKGYLEKGSTRQFYDEARAAFLPDRYVKGTCGFCGTRDQNGDQCESCGKVLDVDSLKDAKSVLSGEPATIKDTVHWFLDLARFGKEVEEWLSKAVLRDHTRAYVTGLLSTGLVKRAMTRDISWGIPVPLEDEDAKGKVLYVWFDAPIGYISNTMAVCAEKEGDPAKVDEWWRAPETEVLHFIGEDNTIFHCVIWIAMLSAEGTLSLPKAVIVNQYLNLQAPGEDVQKISKSRGTAVWVGDLVNEGVPLDSVRYYLTAIAPERARSVYKPDDFVLRHNGELADALGNLVNRITSFTLKYCAPESGPTVVPAYNETLVLESDKAFTEALHDTFTTVTTELEAFNFKAALERTMEFARQCNRYVDEKAPWSTRKTNMEATKVTLTFSLRAIHGLGVLLSPFMPTAAAKILAAFGRLPAEVAWGDVVEYNVVGRPLSQPEILFQKIVVELPEA